MADRPWDPEDRLWDPEDRLWDPEDRLWDPPSGGLAGVDSLALTSRDGGGVLESLGLIVGDDVVEQLGEVAVPHLDESVRGGVDPVIGNSVLREVIRPDLFRPLAGADLAAAVLGDRLLLLA